MVRFNSKVKIILTFISIGMMTSGLSVFVMQAVNYYHVTHSAAGTLESYMSFAKIIVSFFLFSLLLKMGFRKSILIVYAVLVLFCLFLPFSDSIWSIRLFLVIIGICFVAVKIVAYSSVALITKNEKEHASFINLMEAIYTVGSFGGMWIYSFFIKIFPSHWTYVFWFFCFTCAFVFIIWSISPFNETKLAKQEKKSFLEQYKGVGIIIEAVFILFVVLMLSQTMLEVGIGSWLPSFNNEILGIPSFLSVQIASFLVIGIAIGRFIGVFVVKHIKWYKMIFINFSLGLILILIILLNIHHGIGRNAHNIFEVPIIAYGIPLLGVLIGPVYPTLVSTILSSRPSSQHALLISIIMIFGPICDSFSSKLIGILFGKVGGIETFLFVGVTAIVVMLIFIYPYQLLLLKSRERKKKLEAIE
ncbi:MAG: MFS transporter [bacterium]|nr:MFS transporter [bacterium]